MQDDDEPDPDLVALDEFDSPAPIVRAKPGRPKLRQDEKPGTKATRGSWWAKGQNRERFAVEAAERAEELRYSPAASTVKTPINFVN